MTLNEEVHTQEEDVVVTSPSGSMLCTAFITIAFVLAFGALIAMALLN